VRNRFFEFPFGGEWPIANAKFIQLPTRNVLVRDDRFDLPLQSLYIISRHHRPVLSQATGCLTDANGMVCTDKNIVASEAFPQTLRDRITRVIDYSHIQSKISKSYEAQRKLASEHAVFLADDRIINRLPKVLGKKMTRKLTRSQIH
jgi:hypothetical protein